MKLSGKLSTIKIENLQEREFIMKTFFEEAEEQNKEKVAQDPWRLHYHIMPLTGWLNDPNGLCQINGVYHIFYQYSPENPKGGKKCWGHITTKDWVSYKREPIALYPDSPLDKDGAYSGSAFTYKDGKTYFFYTGNIKHPGNFDYINEGRGHFVNVFTSEDGYTFEPKYNVLMNEDYPNNLSCHVRDPKIFFEGHHYYMVLGARTRDGEGCVIIYRSRNVTNWRYYKRLKTDKKFGYMWECPDLFELDGQKVLITCPQGMPQRKYTYQNVHQNGYFILKGKMSDNQSLLAFEELDFGFDFYAPQTFEDDKKRRIMISWMSVPDAEYTNPTVERGWQHCLSIPRELKLVKKKLIQYPIEETKNLRMDKKSFELKSHEEKDLETQVFEAQITPEENEFELWLRKDVHIKYSRKVFSLELGESGYGRTIRNCKIPEIHKIAIFSDTSSLEIFLNEGEKVLSTRLFDDASDTMIKADSSMYVDFFPLKAFHVED